MHLRNNYRENKFMKTIYIVIIYLSFLNITIAFSQDTKATTKDGKVVILRSNGNWFYYNPSISEEQISKIPTQGITATTTAGRIVILKKDGTWTITSNSQKSASYTSASRKSPNKNPNVAYLAKRGQWHKEKWSIYGAMLDKPAPTIELFDWINGEFPLETCKGKIVLLNFWATWCGPCRRSIPEKNELFRKYKSKGVILVGACGSGGRGGQDRMAEAVEKLGIEYPTAKVSNSSVETWYVNSWPTYAIIDRSGFLRAIGIQPGYIEPILEALLEE